MNYERSFTLPDHLGNFIANDAEAAAFLVDDTLPLQNSTDFTRIGDILEID